QQQIYGNLGGDGLNRWMGSLAVDRDGDMALGYSVSSSTANPDIRYAGRLVDDPLNSLPQGETTMLPGGDARLAGRQLRQRHLHSVGRLQRNDSRSRRLHPLVHERVLRDDGPELANSHRLVQVRELYADRHDAADGDQRDGNDEPERRRADHPSGLRSG